MSCVGAYGWWSSSAVVWLALPPMEVEYLCAASLLRPPLPDDDALLPPELSFEEAPSPAPPGSSEARRRQAWARMIRKVFEVDPLLCPRCGVEMEIVAWITEPSVVDAILRHRREHGLVSPFEARAPPAA